MPRLRTVGWLVMMWLVSGLAGFTLSFGFSSGAPALGILALLMSLGVLAGSLLPLSAGLSLWDEGGGRGPVRVPVDFGGQPASQAPAPASRRAGFAATLMGTAPAPASNGVVAVIHEAGSAQGDDQTCTRCGAVLSDNGPFKGSPPTGKTWPPGAWVAEWERALYPLAPRMLEQGEAFCKPAGSLGSWGVAERPADDPAASA